MAVQALRAPMDVAVAEAEVSLRPPVVIGAVPVGDKVVTRCPLLERPCREIPKQPGFKTCSDCTVYRAWSTGPQLHGSFPY
jgi:hypothetical protein